MIGICRWASPISEVIDNRSGILASHYFCYLSGLGIFSMSCCDRNLELLQKYTNTQNANTCLVLEPHQCTICDNIAFPQTLWPQRSVTIFPVLLSANRHFWLTSLQWTFVTTALTHLNASLRTWAFANLAIGINWYWHLDWPFQIRLIFLLSSIAKFDALF